MSKKKNIVINNGLPNSIDNTLNKSDIVGKEAIDYNKGKDEEKKEDNKVTEKDIIKEPIKDNILQEPLVYRLSALQEKVKRIKMEQHYQKLCFDQEIEKKARERDLLVHNLQHELLNAEKEFEILKNIIVEKHKIEWVDWGYNPDLGTLNKISK